MCVWGGGGANDTLSMHFEDVLIMKHYDFCGNVPSKRSLLINFHLHFHPSQPCQKWSLLDIILWLKTSLTKIGDQVIFKYRTGEIPGFSRKLSREGQISSILRPGNMIFEIPVYFRISRPGTNPVYVYASKHVCMNVYMCVCMYMYAWCMHVRMMHTNASIYVCMYNVFMYMYACM